ncbi:MAG: radical SAM family heme chaperone HemW [Acidobacteria bacterium]|jgi:oxygen-independent coproporphyrinogen-3 oxidase|nr:radical SAM family heme chaperone HemW [Acidobacteriota bacterium]
MFDKKGIYIHIPFCKRKCFYCHFIKFRYDAAVIEKYTEALLNEFRLQANAKQTANSRDIIDTIYIGGGSPSLLNEKQISTIINGLYNNFSITVNPEFTIELNPDDITGTKLKSLRNAGINRLSIGTQSFIPADLLYLKRTHSSQQSLKAIEMAFEAGFTNINIDFIISLPTQTRDSLAVNFAVLEKYNIPHISAYILEDVEEGEEKNKRDEELYFFSVDYLKNLGYIQYEVSNFSKKGYRCKHNLKYWQNKSYIGTGVSASGYEHRQDYKNTETIDEYFMKINSGKLPVLEINRSDVNFRGIVMGLRLLAGISAGHFKKYPGELDLLLNNGFLIRKGNRIAAAPEKILLLNEILTYFVPVCVTGLQ